MKLVALNIQCKNDCIKEAFKKSGYKLRTKRVAWPRVKGPKALRIDVTSGSVVSTIQ